MIHYTVFTRARCVDNNYDQLNCQHLMSPSTVFLVPMLLCVIYFINLIVPWWCRLFQYWIFCCFVSSL